MMNRFFLYILLLFFINGSFCQQNNLKQIDSLSNYFEIYKSNPNLGWRITDSIYLISTRLKNDTIILKASYSKGWALFYLGSYDSALFYWEKTADLCTHYNFQKKLGDCKQNIGKIYEIQGKFNKANETYLQSLRIFEELNLQDRVANSFNVIGNLNNNIDNLDIAQKYYFNALYLYEKIRNQMPENRFYHLGYAITLNNLGGLHQRKGDFRNALFFFDKAKEILIQTQDSFYLSFTLKNLGIVYSDLGNYKQAEKCFKESGNYNKYFLNKELYTSRLTAMGNMMLKQKKPLDAIRYFEESSSVADSLDFTQIQLSNLQGLANAYEALSDFKNCYHYFKKYYILKDSILTISKYKQIMELQTMYETEKKEKLIIQKDQQLKQQFFNFWLVSFFITTVSIILFFFFRTHEIRKRYKLEKELNLSTQKALISQMNPHFVFNALNSVQLYILKNDKISSNLFLTNFTNLIRKVLDNSQFQFISLHDEFETLKAYIELEKTRFSDKFDYEIIFPETISLHEINIPPMMLQSFVENSIWHGFSTLEGKGKIKIEVIEQPASTLLIVIEDNGIGRKKANELELKRGKTRKSFGIKLVEERLKLYNHLKKSNFRYEYQDIFDLAGNCKGTKVSIYLSTIPAKR